MTEYKSINISKVMSNKIYVAPLTEIMSLENDGYNVICTSTQLPDYGSETINYDEE